MSREESFTYYQEHEPEELFEVKETAIKLPEKSENLQVSYLQLLR